MKQNIDHHNLGTYKDCKTVKLFTTTKMDHGTNVQSTRSWNSTMFCFCSFIQVQSRRCQARILIFLDSFSEHVLLGGCPGFSGIFQPLKITPAHSSGPAQRWRESPFPGTSSNASHGRPVDHLVPIGYFVSSTLFLTEKESWSPSIYSWTPNHWLPLFKGKKKKNPMPTWALQHQHIYIVVCSKSWWELCLLSSWTRCFDTFLLKKKIFEHL